MVRTAHFAKQHEMEPKLLQSHARIGKSGILDILAVRLQPFSYEIRSGMSNLGMYMSKIAAILTRLLERGTATTIFIYID
jgi:hypothetical protein